MQQFVALLRGINVGGKNKLPMKELLPQLEMSGLTSLRYYIQTGNLIFQCTENDCFVIAQKIATRIKEHFGLNPEVLVLTETEFKHRVSLNPFAEPDGKKLHFYFLYELPATPDTVSLNQLKKDSESWHLRDKIFCLHAPDGIGRSKLAEKVEKCLGVSCTARNANTVKKLLTMLSET